MKLTNEKTGYLNTILIDNSEFYFYREENRHFGKRIVLQNNRDDKEYYLPEDYNDIQVEIFVKGLEIGYERGYQLGNEKGRFDVQETIKDVLGINR